HAEIHLYNPAHPRGRKYSPEELRGHRDQWLELCRTSAQFLASVPARVDVGPLQALIDELEFNKAVAARHEGEEIGTPLETSQFNRCLSLGAISLMDDGMKAEIYRTYWFIRKADAFVRAMPSFNPGSDAWAGAHNRARAALMDAEPRIETALAALRSHLSHEA